MAKRTALVLAVFLSATAAWAQGQRELHLVWLDAHKLFPDFERVRSEADAIFRDLGVSVRWEVGSDPRASEASEHRIQVVLLPSEPSGWGISPNAMGVVLLPSREQQDSVYLFYRPILRNAGLGRRAGTILNPRERKDAARAIARVLIHEVIHAVAPNISHADKGVMHDSLLIGALSSPRIEIDDRTREELLRGLME
jgi:hypothetical protein